MSYTRKLLIVAPYGVGLRDVLFNVDLSDYIRENYSVDVITPLSFKDPSEMGIQNVYWHKNSTLIERLLTSLNHRAINIIRSLDFIHYHQEVGLMPLLEVLEKVSARKNSSSINLRKWEKIGKGYTGTIFRKLLSFFPLLYPLAKKDFLKKYSAVLITHPVEGECSLIAGLANKYKVPVILIPMGVDNFQDGPMLFNPDLILLWGEEQLKFVTEYHGRYKKSVGLAEIRQIGSLSHDYIFNHQSRDVFKNAYPYIDDNTIVVTFAAYVEKGAPGQVNVCERILKFFDEKQLDAHLLVRARPGLDIEMWQEFSVQQKSRVTLQIPEGAFYTKWNNDNHIDISQEREDIALYSSTLWRSDLVVTSTFSTVFLDAYVAGKPACAVGISPDPESAYFLKTIYELYADILPSIKELKFITNFEDLERILKRVLVYGEGKNILEESSSVFYEQILNTNGMSGKLATQFISEQIENELNI